MLVLFVFPSYDDKQVNMKIEIHKHYWNKAMDQEGNHVCNQIPLYPMMSANDFPADQKVAIPTHFRNLDSTPSDTAGIRFYLLYLKALQHID